MKAEDRALHAIDVGNENSPAFELIDTSEPGKAPAEICTLSDEQLVRLFIAAPHLLRELRSALNCLKQYREYGEAMRKIGRGFHANDNGREIDSVLCGIENAITYAITTATGENTEPLISRS
jgi:hypothetical protein